MKKKADQDFNKIYNELLNLYKLSNDQRMVSTLENFKNSKELICRKLNVVSMNDISRIQKERIGANGKK